MPAFKVHYDGWISLPASLRISLALRSGDRLEADLVDGAIVLRTLARTRPSDQAASPAAQAELSGPSVRWSRTPRPPGLGPAGRARFRRRSRHFLAIPGRPGAGKTAQEGRTGGEAATRECRRLPTRCRPGGSDRTAACSRSSAARSATSRYDRSGQVVGTTGSAGSPPEMGDGRSGLQTLR